MPLVKNKNGDLLDKNNYRPIALSSTISKVFENIILHRLEEYLWTTDNQFGFKSGHSTDLCVYELLLLELLESSVIGKQNTLVGLFLVTSTVATTSLVGYCQF